MRKITGVMITLATAALISAATGLAQMAKAEDTTAQATYSDIQKTLGSVPSFFKAFPESSIAGAWSEFKSVQLSKTQLDGKTKELIGLGISLWRDQRQVAPAATATVRHEHAAV